MTRYVLTGIDGSPQSGAAALWAADEAHRRGAALRLLHAWPWIGARDADLARPGDLRPAALDALGEVADRVRRTHPDLEVETAVIADDPVDGLLSASAGHELTVLGSRGLGGFAGLLIGSVGLAVAAHAPVPTVLVRAGRPAAGPGPAATAPGDVVVGVASRQPSEEVLGFAFAEAELRGARLRAVHGWEVMPLWAYGTGMPPQVDVAEQEASETAALTLALAALRDKHPDVEVVEEVRLGGGAGALLAAATGADLLVVGRRTRRHGPGLRLGPVTHGVLHHAPVPVAVVPHP